MPASGYTTRDMAQDLGALLDALAITQADVLGHSFGADIALHFALLYPDRVRALILIEPGIPALLRDRENADWDGWAHWTEIIERFSGEPVPTEKRTDVGYLLRRSAEVPIVYGPARGLPRRADRALKLLDTTTMPTDYGVVAELTLENIARIPHPKLLIYDSASAWLSTYRVLREILQNCSPVLLPPSELRHFVPLDAPELLVEHLRRFLAADDWGLQVPQTSIEASAS
jgi:pimeloyl-ACP methyl ester carboxylesterase